MKTISPVLAAFVLFGLLTLNTSFLCAQAIAPEKSARAAALSDAQFIAATIEDNKDAMFLSRKAIDRAADPRVKELAQQMLDDHTGMLYTMKQLEGAGTGSSKQSVQKIENGPRPAAALNGRLSGVAGADFDTMWVSNVLTMRQAKYDELTQAKETVTNPRLKMAITEAIPIIRRHLSKLKSLQRSLIKMAIQKKKQEVLEKAR